MMKTLRHTLIAAASLLAIGAAQAQQAPDPNAPNPSAATTTGTPTSQAEMNKGVPAVNVDVGSNARNGAVSMDVDKNTDARNLGNTRSNATSTSGTSDMSTTTTTRRTRTARADRG
jgi:hypothetical protein